MVPELGPPLPVELDGTGRGGSRDISTVGVNGGCGVVSGEGPVTPSTLAYPDKAFAVGDRVATAAAVSGPPRALTSGVGSAETQISAPGPPVQHDIPTEAENPRNSEPPTPPVVGADPRNPGTNPVSKKDTAFQPADMLAPGSAEELNRLLKFDEELDERRRTLQEIKVVQDQQALIRERIKELKGQEKEPEG